jgi:hypothetical protein
MTARMIESVRGAVYYYCAVEKGERQQLRDRRRGRCRTSHCTVTSHDETQNRIESRLQNLYKLRVYLVSAC